MKLDEPGLTKSVFITFPRTRLGISSAVRIARHILDNSKVIPILAYYGWNDDENTAVNSHSISACSGFVRIIGNSKVANDDEIVASTFHKQIFRVAPPITTYNFAGLDKWLSEI